MPRHCFKYTLETRFASLSYIHAFLTYIRQILLHIRAHKIRRPYVGTYHLSLFITSFACFLSLSSTFYRFTKVDIVHAASYHSPLLYYSRSGRACRGIISRFIFLPPCRSFIRVFFSLFLFHFSFFFSSPCVGFPVRFAGSLVTEQENVS